MRLARVQVVSEQGSGGVRTQGMCGLPHQSLLVSMRALAVADVSCAAGGAL